MAWSPRGCEKMTDNECATFLFSYMKNIAQTVNNKILYRDVLKYVVGSIMITSEFRFISKNANAICTNNCIKNPIPTHSYEKYGLRIEHTIPISLIVDYLLNLPNTEISEIKILNLVKAIRATSLITKDEDDLLNKKLKSTLPNGCTIEMLLGENPSIPFDIRYKTVGIE